MSKQYGYGPNFQGDPRTFRPDYEMNTEQEIQNWKDDCAAWDRGENPEVPPGGFWTQDDAGNPMHILAPRYGYGSWEWDDGKSEEEANAMCDVERYGGCSQCDHPCKEYFDLHLDDVFGEEL